jgi:hypothetical protein
MRLTRIQVARRLGKSIATVRRLEGRVLFPSRDWRGVHLFDDWEVEQLRERPARAFTYARSEWFEARQKEAKKAAAPSTKDAPRVFAASASSEAYEMTTADVLARALEVLADRLCVIPTTVLARAGIDEELFELVVETLELVRRQRA